MATSYHFDLGNSNEGPVGFCARVVADSEEEALDILRERLESLGQLVNAWDGDRDGDHHEEYIEVYFNGANVTVADIDDFEDAAEDDDTELSA